MRSIVEVTHEFFRKERDNAYSNPRQAFWRELIQNSVDAGARNIRISIEESESDRCNISFDDDGCGMTSEVLSNVFFRLGETTKGGESTGGFGRARIMTHFSMPKYIINTLDNKVEGSGATYEINESDTYINGCNQSILVDNGNAVDMRCQLESYLSYCQLPCNVYIDGERWTNWLYKRREVRELSFGKVYANKSGGNHKGVVFIRVNGTTMYTYSTNANAQVVLEIDPLKSRKVLTSNRDGLHCDYNIELNKFLIELSIDTQSSLKVRRRDKTIIRAGTGGFMSRPKRKKVTVEFKPKDHRPTWTTSIPAAADFVPPDSIDKLFEPVEITPQINLHDVILLDDTENPLMRKVFDSYDPLSWTDGISKGRRFKIGGTKYRLLVCWRIAVEAALEIMQEEFPVDNVSWGIGWYFSDTSKACCKIMDNGVKYFALNPVDKEGRLRWRLTGNEDKAKMFAIALHEVTHIHCKYHDETFSSVHTELSMIGHTQVQSVLRRMKDALVVCG